VRRWFVLSLALTLACLLVVSCASLSELRELKTEVQELGGKLEDAADTIKTLEAEIADAYAKLKAGEYSTEEFLKTVKDLYAQKDAAIEHFNTIKDSYEKVTGKIKNLEESGVAWWQIALYVVLGGLNAYTGSKYFKKDGKLNIALSGITGLVNSLETIYVKKYNNKPVKEALKEVKVKVANLKNPIIDDEVRKIPITVVEQPPKEEPPAKVG